MTQGEIKVQRSDVCLVLGKTGSDWLWNRGTGVAGETRRARAVEETHGAFPTRMTMQKVSGILNALHYICNILTDSTGVWNHE